MQTYRSEYSSSESYSSGMSGGHDFSEANLMSMFGSGGGGMKAQAQKHRYNQSQAHYKHGMGNFGILTSAGRYGEYGQAYNGGGGHVVPFSGGSDMSYNQKYMSTANTSYGGGYGGGHGGRYGGGQYPSNHHQQFAAGGSTEHSAMTHQRIRHHKRSEKRMFHKMKAMSVSGSNYSTRSIHSDSGDDDDEYCSSDYDGNYSGSDSEHYNSESDYEGSHRRNYSRPIY